MHPDTLKAQQYFDAQHLEYENGELVDPHSIGEYLGNGAQNIAFNYHHSNGEQLSSNGTAEKVTKIPIDRIRNNAYTNVVAAIAGPEDYDRACRARDDFAKYFPPANIVTPKIIANKQRTAFARIQPKVQYVECTPEQAVNDPAVRRQLEELAECGRRMMRDKKMLWDPMGFDSRVIKLFTHKKPYLSNIPLTEAPGSPEHGTIALFDDGTFMHPEKAKKEKVPHWRVIHSEIILECQKRNFALLGLQYEDTATNGKVYSRPKTG